MEGEPGQRRDPNAAQKQDKGVYRPRLSLRNHARLATWIIYFGTPSVEVLYSLPGIPQIPTVLDVSASERP